MASGLGLKDTLNGAEPSFGSMGSEKLLIVTLLIEPLPLVPLVETLTPLTTIVPLLLKINPQSPVAARARLILHLDEPFK